VIFHRKSPKGQKVAKTWAKKRIYNEIAGKYKMCIFSLTNTFIPNVDTFIPNVGWKFGRLLLTVVFS
jgi:hypothetical protein